MTMGARPQRLLISSQGRGPAFVRPACVKRLEMLCLSHKLIVFFCVFVFFFSRFSRDLEEPAWYRFVLVRSSVCVNRVALLFVTVLMYGVSIFSGQFSFFFSSIFSSFFLFVILRVDVFDLFCYQY